MDAALILSYLRVFIETSELEVRAAQLLSFEDTILVASMEQNEWDGCWISPTDSKLSRNTFGKAGKS